MARTIWALAALLAALLYGCAAPGPGLPAGAPAALPTPDAPALALETYAATVAGPGEGAALRQALDRVELALAVAPAGDGRRPDLLAAEADLVARLGALEAGPAAGAALSGGAPPQVPAAASTEPAATPTAVPTPALAATVVAASLRPRAAPQPAPTFAVAARKSFEGSGDSGQYASCIDVQILGRGGPVSGAVIGINNGDLSYQDQTDQSGYSGRCGLGASTWSVVVFWAPGSGQAHGSATTVYVSGAPEQRAAVVFQGR